MPAQGHKARCRRNHKLGEFRTAASQTQIALPQSDDIRPQLALNLKPMEVERNIDPRKKIVSKEHPVMRLHVQQLDRKNVRRLDQLIECKYYGCRMTLAPPPVPHRLDAG